MFNLSVRGKADSDAGFLATIWLIFAGATIALCGKLYARYHRFKKFYWDDFFVVLAWVIAIPLAISAMMLTMNGSILNVGTRQNIFLTRPLGQMFFYTSLWSIKLSFLVFFKRLIPSSLRNLRIYWTVVLAITIITYIGVWGVNPYKCWAEKGLAMCEREPAVIKARPVSLSIATALIALTDGLILVIPFFILSNVKQLSRKKTLILYALFSIEIITIIVSIVRCVFATEGMKADRNFKTKWLSFLAHLETDIAIMVACVGSLRSLFTQDDAARSAASGSHGRSQQGTQNKFKFPLSTTRIQLSPFSSRSREQKDSMELPLSNSPAPPPR